MASNSPLTREQVDAVFKLKDEYVLTGMQIPELCEKMDAIMEGGPTATALCKWMESCSERHEAMKNGQAVESEEPQFPFTIPAKNAASSRQTRSSARVVNSGTSTGATGSKRKTVPPNPAPSKRSKAQSGKAVTTQKKVSTRKQVAQLDAQAEHNKAIRNDAQGHRLGASPEFPIDDHEYNFVSDLKLPRTELWSRTATNFKFVNERGHPCVVLPRMLPQNVFMIAVCGSLNGEYEGGVRLACGYWNVDVAPVKRAAAAPVEIVWLRVKVEKLMVETIDLLGDRPRETLVVQSKTGHYILQSSDPAYHGRWQMCREYFDPYDDFLDADFTGNMPRIFPDQRWWYDLQDEYRRAIAKYGEAALNPQMPKMCRAEQQLVKAEIQVAIAWCTWYDLKYAVSPRIGNSDSDPLEHASRSKKRHAAQKPVPKAKGDVVDPREAQSQIQHYKGIVDEKRKAYEKYLTRHKKAVSGVQVSKGKGKQAPVARDSESESKSEKEGEDEGQGQGGRDGEGSGHPHGHNGGIVGNISGAGVGQQAPSRSTGIGNPGAATTPSPPSSRVTSRRATPTIAPAAPPGADNRLSPSGPIVPAVSDNSIIASGHRGDSFIPPLPLHSASVPPPDVRRHRSRRMSLPTGEPEAPATPPSFNPQIVVLPPPLGPTAPGAESSLINIAGPLPLPDNPPQVASSEHPTGGATAPGETVDLREFFSYDTFRAPGNT